jgi:hypothetical protein
MSLACSTANSSCSSSASRPPRAESARNTPTCPRSMRVKPYPGDLQRLRQQPNHLGVGLDAGMAIELGADLQRLAGGGQPGRQGMQHAAAIAQARHPPAVEQMGVDAGHLRRDVGAQAHGAAGELIDQLEGAQIHVPPAAGEQRLEVLEQRRHHQLVAMQRELVEQRPAQALQPARLEGQDILDGFGQDPAAHRNYPITSG